MTFIAILTLNPQRGLQIISDLHSFECIRTVVPMPSILRHVLSYASDSQRSVTAYAQPREPELLAETQEQTRIAMRNLHRLKPNVSDDFDVLTPEAGRSFLARLTGMPIGRTGFVFCSILRYDA
jgi:hypothetical protein